jgi:hypothetical protein
MLYVALSSAPYVTNDGSWEKIGVSWEEVEKVLSLVSLSHPQAVTAATASYNVAVPVADRPSIYRRHPCIRFGERGKNERIRAPLPELIFDRITSGIFYDLQDGVGGIRTEYGNRFEEYCYLLFTRMLPKLTWQSEWQYGTKGRIRRSPDIVCSIGGEVELAVECKATRMSHYAKFGKFPGSDRGIDDMVKAVVQLWRFFGDVRLGRARIGAGSAATGVVLTLDDWLVLAKPLVDQVHERASTRSAQEHPELIDADRRPIVFVTISELERILSTANEGSFLEAIKLAADPNQELWSLRGVHANLIKDKNCAQEELPVP